ncbi:TPA: hypothetical protein DDW35_13620 [Candidatus Sumerlaeota bacterium]|jgi:hypothetical protein|nr:hypothetical protein [Candidatus Sumerlaeota bacterium]
MTFPFRVIGYLFLLTLFAFTLTGCGVFRDIFAFTGSDLFQDKTAMFNLDADYSVNIAHVEEKWPDNEAKLPPVQQEVIKQMGIPSHVHLWWGKDERELISKPEYFSSKGAGDAEAKPRKISWVYLDKNKEVFFKPGKSEEFDVKDLPAKVRATIESGDPEKITHSTDDKDQIDVWRYLKSGRIYYFRNNLLERKDTTSLPPVSNYKSY